MGSAPGQPPPADLVAAIAEQALEPVPQAVTELVAALLADLPGTVASVLYYGSTLRTGQLKDQMLDFYILADDYGSFHDSRLSAWGNQLVPPNVYYWEGQAGGQSLRCKYATLSLNHFDHLTSDRALNCSIWARFSQPTRIVWARDAAASERAERALAQAVLTMLGQSRGLLAVDLATPAQDWWVRALQATFATELRAEKTGRAQELVSSNAERYERVTALALPWLEAQAAPNPKATRFRWLLRRIEGKITHVLRLLKAAGTFTSGIDYLAWKIHRHSGQTIETKPWHRAHPRIAGLWLLILLRWRGAFR